MVKPVATVNVTPKLPGPLERLEELAYNLRWSWDQASVALFRRLDPQLWEQTGHNPVAMLGQIDQKRLENACNDAGYMSSLERVLASFDDYMSDQSTWYRNEYGDKKQPVIAYFSMEFGLTECFQNYSGGLGVLSGDHLKSASDLGLPLVGVGLLYQEGYFHQYLNSEGWQQELYPLNDYTNLPVTLQRGADGTPLMVDVPLPGRKLYAHIWKVQVGRVPLYLLDTNIAINRDDDRDISDRLYGGDRRTRIRQEILMGIGGIRALELLGLRPDICHMNEGHSAFLGLERIRQLMVEEKISFEQAREIIAASTVFTVHTPVPAGLERFGFDLIDEHFTDYMRELGLSRDQFIDLGRENMGDYELFSMSVMALKMSYGANGVARLHGEVSRQMWQWLYPGVPQHEVPITSITNGVHVETWVSDEMGSLLDRYLDPAWRTEPERADVWAGIDQVPDPELWRTHARRRERLVAFTRQHLRAQLLRRGVSQSELKVADEVLNPDTLTIGFARRFATYKRATLIFQDLDHLDRIVNNPDRPVQFIFSGKAHPHDNLGKEFIRRFVEVASMPQFRHSLVFLENYDMNVARYMVQGCDVWLNNPRRPKEASGTSGMKGIYNGCLNFSILDGWWAEAYNVDVGWAIGNGEEYNEKEWEYQDEVESRAIYNVLENEIVPSFYNRSRGGLPRDWIARMKSAFRTLAPYFNTYRMVHEYATHFYMPNYERISQMKSGGLQAALQYADWRNALERVWSQIAVLEVNVTEGQVTVGSETEITATVKLGQLSPDDVLVQLYYGNLDNRGEIANGQPVEMSVVKQVNSSNTFFFRAVHQYSHTGAEGISVRVLPRHTFLDTPFQPNLITWA